MADRPLELSVASVKQLAADIRAGYDWCLIDAPAGLGQGFQMAACMADQVVVITTTDVSAMRDAQRTAMELSAFPTGTVHLVVGRVSKKVLRQLHHHRRRHRRRRPAAFRRRAGGTRTSPTA